MKLTQAEYDELESILDVVEQFETATIFQGTILHKAIQKMFQSASVSKQKPLIVYPRANTRYFIHKRGFGDGTKVVAYDELMKVSYALDDSDNIKILTKCSLEKILYFVEIGSWIEVYADENRMVDC